MKMKYYFYSLIILATTFILTSNTSIVWGQTDTNTIKVGVLVDFPPQYSIDKKTGKPVGFAIDIIEAVASRDGYKVSYEVFKTWADMHKAIKKKQIDLIPNMGITPDRKEFATFTTPVETFNVRIFIRSATLDISTINDLKGRRVSIVRKHVGIRIMKEREGSELIIHPSASEALLALLSGKSDAVIIADPPFNYIAKEAGVENKIKMVGKPLIEIKRAIGIRKDRPDLFKRLNQSVETLIRTPLYSEIYTKWYGKRKPFWADPRVPVAMGIIFLFIIVGLAISRYLTLVRLNEQLSKNIIERKQTEEALRQYKHIVSSSTSMMALLDERFIYIAVNEAYLNGFNKTHDEMIGQTISDVFGKAFFDTVIKPNALRCLAGEVVNYQSWMEFPSYGRRYIDITYYPYIGVDNKVKGFVVNGRNITERKQAEESLRTVNVLLEKTFASLKDALFVVDAATRTIIRCNLAVEHIFGYSEEETLGRNTEFLHVNQAMYKRFGQELLSALNAEGVFQTEFQMKRKDGSIFFSEHVVTETLDDTEHRTIVISVVRDITERKKAEEELINSKNQMELFSLATTNMLWNWDLINGTVERSIGFERAFGYRNEDITADIEWWIDRLHPDDKDRVMSVYSNTVETGGLKCSYEYRFRCRDGSYAIISDNAYIVRNKDGKAVRSLGAMTDITERKQAEEELQKYRQHLEALVEERTAELTNVNKELEAFSYSVSHDLRSPLRSIDGFSHALLEDNNDQLDETGKDYLGRVRKASQHMGMLIDDLLSLSRVSRHEIRRETVDLSLLGHDVIARLKESQPDRHVVLRIEEGVIANGDAKLMRIVLDNLLGNAWKFSNEVAKPEIDFGTIKKDGKKVYFVRDNGAGFDMQYADKLFNAFQRLHSVDEFPGTGIGLATVQRIINRHGGRVWAKSEVDKGATFYFTLS